MAKSKSKTKNLPSRGKILGIGIISGIIIIVGYLVYLSMIPVNGDYPVFSAPSNIYIKTISTPNGSIFTTQSIKGGKNVGAPNGIHYPTYTVSKGNLVSIHLINEDTGTTNFGRQHDINVDEFNVHSKILNHFESQTITFIADKKGTFEYYCSLHPEMRGTIKVV